MTRPDVMAVPVRRVDGTDATVQEVLDDTHTDAGDTLLCLGIHGQLVYVVRRTRTVCVKLSSWPDVTHEDEAFFLRVYAASDFRFKGADLGILVTKGRMQTADGLTQRCRAWIDGIRSHYQSEAVDPAPDLSPIAYVM